MEASEENGLEMLVELFDWLDGLESQGTTGVVRRAKRHEAKTTVLVAPVDQVVAKKANDSAVSCSPGARLLSFSHFRWE